MNQKLTPYILLVVATAISKISKVYIGYTHSISKAEQGEGLTPKDREDLNHEKVLIEHNFDQVYRLWDLDQLAFFQKYGKYATPEVTDMDILLEVLIGGGDT